MTNYHPLIGNYLLDDNYERRMDRLKEINRRVLLLEDMFLYEQKTIHGEEHLLLAIPKRRYLE